MSEVKIYSALLCMGDASHYIDCVLAYDYDQLKAENEVLTLRVMAGERQELDALKSAPVVMPNRMTDGAADYAYARYSAGWNACLDEFAHLNGGKP